MTRLMSCSTSRTAIPSEARLTRILPRAVVSSWLSPALGSSRRRTDGVVAMARASSTRRARPVGRESVGSSAMSSRPTWARRRSVTADGVVPVGRRRRWVSAAIWTFSRAVRVSKSSRRWKVRAMPRRARTWGDERVMSVPSKRTRPRVGGWRPVMTLKRVVLPAPLGPMRPWTVPARTATSTSFRAWMPPKRTVICSATSSANGTHLGLDGSPDRGRRRIAATRRGGDRAVPLLLQKSDTSA